jgi:hypothetical protein
VLVDTRVPESDRMPRSPPQSESEESEVRTGGLFVTFARKRELIIRPFPGRRRTSFANRVNRHHRRIPCGIIRIRKSRSSQPRIACHSRRNAARIVRDDDVGPQTREVLVESPGIYLSQSLEVLQVSRIIVPRSRVRLHYFGTDTS